MQNLPFELSSNTYWPSFGGVPRITTGPVEYLIQSIFKRAIDAIEDIRVVIRGSRFELSIPNITMVDVRKVFSFYKGFSKRVLITTFQ